MCVGGITTLSRNNTPPVGIDKYLYPHAIQTSILFFEQ